MIELTSSAIEIPPILTFVSHPEAGGNVLFVGTVRDRTPSNGDRRTDYLVYEAYEEMALKKMNGFASEAKARWDLRAVAIVHRLGKVLPEQASIVIAVSCPHRGPAFEAAEWLIESIKLHVPIWKQEHYVNSTSEWIHPSIPNCGERRKPS